MRVLRCGPVSWLVECASSDEVAAVHRHLQTDADVVEAVPAATTVLVETRSGAPPHPTVARAGARSVADAQPAVQLATRYDGPDLAAVAELTGLAESEVVRRHLSAQYTVAFCGFAPGFGYLVGGDPALNVPRRPSPRAAVAAGSVGLAGPYTGVYPRRSPGGWQLIGTTDAPLWDLERPEPALLAPGRIVRFVAVDR